MIDMEKLRQASEMWKQGGLARDIAKLMGIKVEALAGLCIKYRSMFPKRSKRRLIINGVSQRIPLPEGQTVTPRKKKEEPPAPPPPQVFEDRMGWITVSGAAVTLPRISFIECPRAST